jgi:hypothetical protein
MQIGYEDNILSGKCFSQPDKVLEGDPVGNGHPDNGTTRLHQLVDLG